MNMKTDQEIINEFCKTRNHANHTMQNYKSIFKLYTQFQGKSLYELIQEAEQEELDRIRWKDRKLRERLINFRQYLYDNYLYTTAHTQLFRIFTLYRFYEIELQPLPYVSTKQLQHATPITYHDLPDKEIISNALQISNPLLTAIILFMSSSGTAKAETLNLTIQNFTKSLSTYTSNQDIYGIITELKDKNNIIPLFKILRKKTNEYYYTFCSPEATEAIFDYLLTRKDKLKPESKLFKISGVHLTKKFIRINERLGLGKKGTYGRFRSHMLRKYHASTLKDNENKLSIQDIDFLQGRSDSKTRKSYFMTNEEKLRLRYAESMNNITINKKYNVIADYETLSLHVEEYDAEEEIKPLQTQTIELKKENEKLLEENNNMKENIKVEARKVFEDILKENGIKL